MGFGGVLRRRCHQCERIGEKSAEQMRLVSVEEGIGNVQKWRGGKNGFGE
jgi:hypothetical protein